MLAFRRALQLPIATSARRTPNGGGLLSSGAYETTDGTTCLARCFRKSLLRNFPEDDVMGFLRGPNDIQRRSLRTSVIQTAPVAAKFKRNDDDFGVDPEMVTKYVVRPASAVDCGDILRLIYDLAEWEGTADHVEITEGDLIRDGFGDHPLYKCMLLEAQGEDEHTKSVVGYAMFTHGYCAWKGRTVTWEDLFIHKDHRGKGLGAVLLHEVCKFGYFNGCKYIGGYVDFENERAKQWYEGIGFENLTERHGYNLMSMTGSPLASYVHTHRPMEKLGRRGVRVESEITS